jgi:hypothetical protein
MDTGICFLVNSRFTVSVYLIETSTVRGEVRVT